jgi:hypothetical protein
VHDTDSAASLNNNDRTQNDTEVDEKVHSPRPASSNSSSTKSLTFTAQNENGDVDSRDSTQFITSNGLANGPTNGHDDEHSHCTSSDNSNQSSHHKHTSATSQISPSINVKSPVGITSNGKVVV